MAPYGEARLLRQEPGTFWLHEVLLIAPVPLTVFIVGARDKFGESLGGSQAPPSFWRASGRSPDFPGSSPNFPGNFSATSPEVLSLWNLTAIQGFPGSFPNFPGSSTDFSGSSGTSPEAAASSGKPDTLSWLAETFSERLGARADL